MVNTELIERKLNELNSFYGDVKNISQETWDLEKSKFSLKETEVLISLIKSKRENLKNTDLKRLLNGFTNLTRGIERFANTDLELKHNEVSKGIYEIQQDLYNHIKW